MRVLYLAAGWLSLGIGIAGVFLPLLPTTVFILIAAWAFARSSPSLHRKLLAHPRFGPMITAWQEHGGLSRRNKRWATFTILLAFAISIGWVWERYWLVILLLLIMVSLLIFLWTRNEVDHT